MDIERLPPERACSLEEFLADPSCYGGSAQLGETNTYTRPTIGVPIVADNIGERNLVYLQSPAHLSRTWVLALSRPNIVMPQAAVGVNVVGPADQRQAFARVRWGSGGFEQEVEIDWRQGGLYAFAGNSVRAASVMPVAQSPLAGGDLVLGGTLAPADSVSASVATRTRYLGTVAAVTTSPAFSIPAFARRMLIMLKKVATVDLWHLEYFRVNTSVAGPEVAVVASSLRSTWSQDVWTPVPANMTHFTFTNDDAVQPMDDIQVVFELAL